jgi:hypothetical protein
MNVSSQKSVNWDCHMEKALNSRCKKNLHFLQDIKETKEVRSQSLIKKNELYKFTIPHL